jgi:hypothetical protein
MSRSATFYSDSTLILDILTLDPELYDPETKYGEIDYLLYVLKHPPIGQKHVRCDVCSRSCGVNIKRNLFPKNN